MGTACPDKSGSFDFVDHEALMPCIHAKRYCIFENTPRDQTVSSVVL